MDLEDIPYNFKFGVRAIMLIHRNKDSQQGGNTQRKSIKRISRGSHEYDQICREMQLLQEREYPNHRLYASVNCRDMNKAIREFKHRMINSEHDGQEQKEWFYVDIQNSFFSCLMQPSSKEGNSFLIDCDSVEDFNNAMSVLQTNGIPMVTYPTKNGSHILADPFNVNLLKCNEFTKHIEIHKDGLICIG